MKPRMQIDRYARDAALWRNDAEHKHRAAKLLFGTGDPYLLFTAATLGHAALEIFLKAALIGEGLTAFDPNCVGRLDPPNTLKPDDCVWGHGLATLARMLAAKRRDFKLASEFVVPAVILKMPMTILDGFETFDPF